MAGVSSNVVTDIIVSIIRVLEPKTVCDIGAGQGKYGLLLRQVAELGGSRAKSTAVEIDRQYVEEYGLAAIYDEVIVADALDLLRHPRRRFDLVIIGDCIEHMRKSAGIDLLNFLVYRSGYIAVAYPIEYVQDGPDDHAQESHISIWSPSDFAGMNCIHATRSDGRTRINIALIKGYQPMENAVTAIGDDGLDVRYHGNTGTIPFAVVG